MVLIRSRMLGPVTPSSVSAQSPPWRRNASPRATAASFSRRRSHSPAKTSGGKPFSVVTARSSASGSAQLGCCFAGRSPQSKWCPTWGAPVTSVVTPTSSEPNRGGPSPVLVGDLFHRRVRGPLLVVGERLGVGNGLVRVVVGLLRARLDLLADVLHLGAHRLHAALDLGPGRL